MHALFVFAHQDDEIAAAARMRFLLREGAALSVVFLTDGQGRGAQAAVRDEESRRALARVGVDRARVHFLGSEHRIPDGALVEHLDRALALLEERVTEPVDEVWCLSWEGGHHDHDASHLVALLFAKRRGLLDRVYEVPLYQGYRLRGPFFQTLKPLPAGGPWTGRRIPLREGLWIAALCRFYRTQRRTWLGLLPSAMLRLVLGHREWTRRADPARVREKPHEGALFYERRFHVPWERFERCARPFIDAVAAPSGD
ncbi:MAG TPA: PIG-L family deacetylase [Thermoanaerobaculia bacterium]|nr:PIG-L family deacetylase [Thermoanaerobaculia bacterium]